MSHPEHFRLCNHFSKNYLSNRLLKIRSVPVPQQHAFRQYPAHPFLYISLFLYPSGNTFPFLSFLLPLPHPLPSFTPFLLLRSIFPSSRLRPESPLYFGFPGRLSGSTGGQTASFSPHLYFPVTLFLFLCPVLSPFPPRPHSDHGYHQPPDHERGGQKPGIGLSVGMHPAQVIIHPEISHQHRSDRQQ